MKLAIDTHAHVYPSEYLDLLEAGGAPADRTRIARDLGADSTEEDMAERIAWMDRAGVALQVLAVTPQSPSLPSAQASARAARWINDEYARLMREHPGRFLAYAALPLPHVDEALVELDRIETLPGFVGISVPAFLPSGMSLADDRFNRLWAALDEKSMVVNIHPTGAGAFSPQIVDHGLEWVNGALVEDATATLQLLKADIPHRHPKIRFHVAHLGGDLPFMMQRLEDNYEGWSAFPRSPRQSLQAMHFDAANFFEPSLRLAVEAYGLEPILAGSDMPYFRGEQYVRAFDYIRTSALQEGQKDAILYGSAAALYGIDGEHPSAAS